ncbi:hypothetical protein [uncultured Dokdonia sp.]|uniref:hypothetical protein n=1 Tax=uncultured Dokdonia sp. TaxID=575653 RepID=UPI002630AA34|nr:hypothetical protein [uncultured Dokdonia sp.]
MNKNKTSIFLELIFESSEKSKKPLLSYIQEFDSSIPIYLYQANNLEQVVEKEYKHIDHLFLDNLAAVNVVFLMKYLWKLRSIDKSMDISVQKIIELSLLEDADDKPDCKVFEDSYLPDVEKRIIMRHRKFVHCKILASLNPIDLEFYRRLQECITNSQIELKDYYTLDNEKTLVNPFIDYENNNIDLKVISYVNHIKEKKDANKRFLDTIKAPEDVYFDGERLTFLDKDSPVSMIFNINRNNKKYNVGGRKVENHHGTEIIGGIDVEHPSTLTLSFNSKLTGEKIKKNAWNSYDYNWSNVLHDTIKELGSASSQTNRKELIDKLKRIELILELKNGNSKNSKNLIKNIREHSLRVVGIESRYDEPVDNLVNLATELITSTDKGIMVVFDTSNGYIKVEIFKSKLNKVRKLETRATFYNENNEAVMTISPYFEDTITEKDKTDIFGHKSGTFRKSFSGYKTFLRVNFSRFFQYSTPILVDYNGHLDFDRLKSLEIDISESNSVRSSVLSSPPNVVNNKIENLYYVNNISTYLFWLNRVIENGNLPPMDYLRNVNLIYTKMKFLQNPDIELQENYMSDGFEELQESYEQFYRFPFLCFLIEKEEVNTIDTSEWLIIPKYLEFNKIYNK